MWFLLSSQTPIDRELPPYWHHIATILVSGDTPTTSGIWDWFGLALGFEQSVKPFANGEWGGRLLHAVENINDVVTGG